MDANRLGLFGGTFDPPHLGHVAALTAAWRTGRYDQLLVTVAGDPYLKSPVRTVTDAGARLAMAHAAFDDLVGVAVSDLEIRRGGESYTIDTVVELIADGWRVELLVGADAAQSLDGWHEAPRLATLVTVGVLPRVGGFISPRGKWRLEELDMEPVDLSSSWIRDRVMAGADVAEFLPDKVIPLFAVSDR